MSFDLLITQLKNKQWRKKIIRYWIKDPFWGGLDYIAHYGLRYLPININAKIGQVLGALAGKYRFKAEDARVKKNLEVLRPDLTEEQRDLIRLKMWQNLGQSMCEYSLLDKLHAQQRVSMQHQEYLQPFIEKKQSVIFVFSHTGNWELFGNYVTEYGFDIIALYKPVRNRFARKIAEAARDRMGGVIKLLEPAPNTMREICKHLANDGALWLAMDEYKNGQVLCPRFGRDGDLFKINMAYAVRLAQRYDAFIVPIWTTREKDSRFTIDFSKPFKVAKGDDALKESLLELEKTLEHWIKNHLDQWYMLHELRL